MSTDDGYDFDQDGGFAMTPGSAHLSSPSEIVTAFLKALEQKRFDDALLMVSENVEWDNVPMGKVFGPDGIRKVVSSGITADADRLEWIVLRQIASGATVCNERIDRFLVRGTWIEIAVAGIFELRNDKIILWRDYFDRETFVKQLAVSTG
jgi:limonene-1,2-epoxide hydrolase